MSELNIGKVIIDQTKTSQVVVNYADTSKPDTSTITSNRSQMTATVESITTAFEASKTYYFDENGNPVTTNQGYGTLGTTDSNGVLTVAHSIPSITALTTDPESPEPATNFELSGESTCLVGEELTLQYSTDDSTWLPLGVATVQPDGTWSKADCQIATAGTYYLRAIYGAEVVESVSISVTVESGVTMLVIDNAKYIREMNISDFSLGANLASATTNCNGVATDSDNYYFTDYDYHVVRCYDKATNTLKWTSGTFNTYGSADNLYSNPRGIDCYGNYLYVADTGNARIKKIKKSDGSYVSKIALSPWSIYLFDLKINQSNGDMYVATYDAPTFERNITKVTQAGVQSTVLAGISNQTYGFDYYDGYLYFGGLTAYHLKKIRVSDGVTIWDKDFSVGSREVTSISVISATELIVNLYKSTDPGTKSVKMRLSDGFVTDESDSVVTTSRIYRSAITR